MQLRHSLGFTANPVDDEEINRMSSNLVGNLMRQVVLRRGGGGGGGGSSTVKQPVFVSLGEPFLKGNGGILLLDSYINEWLSSWTP